MTAGAGNLADWADVALAVNPPSVKLVQATAQATAFTSGSAIAVTFGTGSEVIDTNGWHDETTNNTRITPNIAGVYDVWGCVMLGGRTDWLSLQAFIRTTGATAVAPAGKPAVPATSVNTTIGIHVPLVTVQLNGSSDYVELLCNQSNTAGLAASSVVSFQLASTLELKLRYKV